MNSNELSRRGFLASSAGSAVAASRLMSAGAAENAPTTSPVIDTHMHVWGNDPVKYPFPYPYSSDFKGAPHEATVEMLVEDMDRHGCTHSVLVQVIYHGWDNTYLADCVKQYPDRFKAHGLIDPTDPRVAHKLEYWVKEHGLHGMRFSPIYYQNGTHGGDGWLDGRETHRLWEVAEELGATFNFFIAAAQLPKLETMVRAHPEVGLTIDHLSQIDLGADDPEPDFRRLLAMVQYPNVYVKVSELTSVSKSGKYPFEDAWPWVKRVYEAFGPDRLLFGTGYPGAARADYQRPTLDKEIELIRDIIPFFTPEDSKKILGLNAAKLWGFSV